MTLMNIIWYVYFIPRKEYVITERFEYTRHTLYHSRNNEYWSLMLCFVECSSFKVPLLKLCSTHYCILWNKGMWNYFYLKLKIIKADLQKPSKKSTNLIWPLINSIENGIKIIWQHKWCTLSSANFALIFLALRGESFSLPSPPDILLKTSDYAKHESIHK